MRSVHGPRASAVLFNLLKSQRQVRPWLLPANICPIVPLTFFKAQVPFELVDIDADTMHMDLERALQRVRGGAFGGVLYAHSYGDAATPEDWFGEVASHGALVIDDRCLCAPDLVPRSTGAGVVLYSTGYAKQVELNYGGYAFIDDTVPYQASSLPFDAAAHDRVEQSYKQALRSGVRYAYRDEDWLETTTQMAWPEYCARIELEKGTVNEHKQRLNAVYARSLPPEIQLPPAYQQWRFNIRVEQQQRVIDAIFAAGLFASAHYASLCGIMATGDCPRAAALAGQVINLFNDRHFTEAQAQRACRVIADNLS